MPARISAAPRALDVGFPNLRNCRCVQSINSNCFWNSSFPGATTASREWRFLSAASLGLSAESYRNRAEYSFVTQGRVSTEINVTVPAAIGTGFPTGIGRDFGGGSTLSSARIALPPNPQARSPIDRKIRSPTFPAFAIQPGFRNASVLSMTTGYSRRPRASRHAYIPTRHTGRIPTRPPSIGFAVHPYNRRYGS